EQGEPEHVWRAIYEHYKPLSMEDRIPRTHAGQIVALADKLDTLRACFGVGLAPTGSKDPFALRRAAQGVIRILCEARRLKVSLVHSLNSALTIDLRLIVPASGPPKGTQVLARGIVLNAQGEPTDLAE